jgi:hypothetical protein
MNERQAMALTLRRDQRLTFREIGQRLGVTGGRANQLYVDALYREQRDDGGLSIGTSNCLKRSSLTLADTRLMTDGELLRIPNLGIARLEEIRAAAPLPQPDPLLEHFDQMSAARLGGY